MTLDENGNPIIEDENNDGWEELTTEQLQEQLAAEREAREKAEQDANKWKTRFKTTKANENNSKGWLDEAGVKKMIDDSVSVVNFYSENKQAKEYQNDIESLVAKWIERERAYTLILAEKDPTLLLDEQKKAQLAWNTALNWVPWRIGTDPRNLSDEEIAKMSDADFEKAFPVWWQTKKFYAETS